MRVAGHRSIAVPRWRVLLSTPNCRGKRLLVVKGVQAGRKFRWATQRTEGPSRRRKADHIYSKANKPSAAVLAAQTPHSFPSTLQTTNRRYPSTPRTSGVRLGASSGHWSLVSSHLMQQDHHCVPCKSPHRVEDISYYSRGLQAETATTHPLHGVFHDAQRRARSVSQGLVGAVLSVFFCETARLSSS